MLTTSSFNLNGNPSIQSSIFPSLNHSRHQQSQISSKSLLLQTSLKKKKKNGKSLKYWIQSSKEGNYGIWWNGKVSLKTKKDPLGNQPKASRISLNLSRIYIPYILKIQAPIIQELDSYGAWWGEELPKVPLLVCTLRGILLFSVVSTTLATQ
ncbi:hypothetical protein O181_018300 [Austropuccinia psidii MF-1]|uniref:Uncharacterized protein n=1 Tax=Austropuccinia psidii MF-1 TaxID=1389203 RepID=A0A9Q3GTX2_9BASI|nr:hypothetical protein [Austropuccinia psidii MF-1]